MRKSKDFAGPFKRKVVMLENLRIDVRRNKELNFSFHMDNLALSQLSFVNYLLLGDM